MPHWLEIVLLVGITSLFWLALLSGVVITCSYRVYRARVKENLAAQRAKELQHILDGYGMRELTIGKEKEK